MQATSRVTRTVLLLGIILVGADGARLGRIVEGIAKSRKDFTFISMINNAIVDDAQSQILRKDAVNLGCAVDTEHGLMVPVIHGANTLSIGQLGQAVGELARGCKDRSIERERLAGGTFTISNVGSYGGMFATPIINYPEVAILAVGRAKEKVLAENGRMFVGTVMPLSLSCDHRVVDGAEGARFLNTVVRLLENPQELID